MFSPLPVHFLSALRDRMSPQSRTWFAMLKKISFKKAFSSAFVCGRIAECEVAASFHALYHKMNEYFNLCIFILNNSQLLLPTYFIFIYMKMENFLLIVSKFSISSRKLRILCIFFSYFVIFSLAFPLFFYIYVLTSTHLLFLIFYNSNSYLFL